MLSFDAKNRDELEEFFKKHGSTIAEFKEKAYENAAVDLLINEKCYMDVYITPKHIYDYYAEYKSDFTTPEQVRLQILKLKADGVHKDELIRFQHI